MSAHYRKCDCYDCTRSRDKRRAFWFAVGTAAVLVLAAFLFIGCASTVTPAAVQSNQASFDGGAQNSGILATQPGGFTVTAHFRDRYNALVADYGTWFAPALQRDEGLLSVTSDVWFIDAAHLVKFIQMNSWKKSGRLPLAK